MTIQQRTSMGWSGLAIATLFIVLLSSLILYPQVTPANILSALRVSSLTTAIPLLLVFAAQPLASLNATRGLGRWAQTNRRFLWLTLTLSHLLHLYQIWLYYQLGQSCPWTVWAITSPLWVIMVLVSAIALVQPQLFEQMSQGKGAKGLTWLYGLGCSYIWLVFTLAFGLGALTQHLLVYNVPALILFLAAAIVQGLSRWRQAIA